MFASLGDETQAEPILSVLLLPKVAKASEDIGKPTSSKVVAGRFVANMGVSLPSERTCVGHLVR